MSNDDNGKLNSSDSDYFSANDAAGTNRNHPVLMRRDTGKEKRMCGVNK